MSNFHANISSITCNFVDHGQLSTSSASTGLRISGIEFSMNIQEPYCRYTKVQRSSNKEKNVDYAPFPGSNIACGIVRTYSGRCCHGLFKRWNYFFSNYADCSQQCTQEQTIYFAFSTHWHVCLYSRCKTFDPSIKSTRVQSWRIHWICLRA